jgi:hypothetical protein
LTQPRLKGRFSPISNSETDLAFLPLLTLEANREYYSIEEFNSLSLEDRALYSVAAHPGYKSQYDSLNQRLEQGRFDKESHLIVYTSTLTLSLKNVSSSVFVENEKRSLVKVMREIPNFETEKENNLIGQYQLRGYGKRKLEDIEFNKWFATDGESLDFQTKTPALEAVEGFVARIPSIHIVREIKIKEIYSALEASDSGYARAGYRLWEQDESKKRLNFLYEFIRRTETTRLRKLRYKNDFDEDRLSLYSSAMLSYYRKLKKLYSVERQNLKRLSHGELYLWIVSKNN